MINSIKNNITFRKGFIIGVILLIIFNIAFISLYYIMYLNDKINENYTEIALGLEKNIVSITNEVEKEKNINLYLENYAEENNLIISLKNQDNKDIYNFNDNNPKNVISKSGIIKYNNEYYLITISKKQNIFNGKTAINFLAIEIIFVMCLALAGILSANKKILEPLTSLSKDFSNYKLGILPRKRIIRGGVDTIQNDFVDLVDKLEDEKAKQSRIIASISHDIKTPLTSILGYSERLLTSENLSDETKKKYANTIYNKSLVMKEIVEEFDDYLSCNIKDDKKEETISISALIDYLNKYYKEDLKEKEIDFKVKTNCPNKLISVDLAKFKRIFSNTITNSIRHLKNDKKILNININEQKDGKIKFEIADNGIGCKEDLEKIFEPLYTTDTSRKISGLGLSICKEIVLSHNGTIKAENNKLGGFSIIFIIDSYKEK